MPGRHDADDFYDILIWYYTTEGQYRIWYLIGFYVALITVIVFQIFIIIIIKRRSGINPIPPTVIDRD